MPRVPNHLINRDVFTFYPCSSQARSQEPPADLRCTAPLLPAAHDSRIKRGWKLTSLDRGELGPKQAARDFRL